MFLLFCTATPALFAQTNSETANTLPKLLPPYGELPPTFWEQHGTTVVIATLAALALLALVSCWRFRAKPRVILPPEVLARQSLEALRPRPEDGALLSRVSQILRNYFSAAFQLPPGELTTTEFVRAISSSEQIGLELSTGAANFLRACDERKFSPANSSAPVDAANRALKIVALAEQRRAQLRQVAETQGQRA